MRKWCCIVLILCLFIPSIHADIIITKQNRKYNGKVIRVTEKGFVVRTSDGSVIVLPKNSVSKIFRGNKVLDLENRMSYYVEIRHPYLPFAVLGIATGVYAVSRYQDYRDHKEQADRALQDAGATDHQYLADKSKSDLAWSIISGLFSIGSFYVALRPMEVKIPIGRINLSANSNRITLALNF